MQNPELNAFEIKASSLFRVCAPFAQSVMPEKNLDI